MCVCVCVCVCVLGVGGGGGGNARIIFIWPQQLCSQSISNEDCTFVTLCCIMPLYWRITGGGNAVISNRMMKNNNWGI